MSPPVDREQAAYWRGAYEQRRALRVSLRHQLEATRKRYRRSRTMALLARLGALDYALQLADTVRPVASLVLLPPQSPLPLPKPARRRKPLSWDQRWWAEYGVDI